MSLHEKWWHVIPLILVTHQLTYDPPPTTHYTTQTDITTNKNISAPPISTQHRQTPHTIHTYIHAPIPGPPPVSPGPATRSTARSCPRACPVRGAVVVYGGVSKSGALDMGGESLCLDAHKHQTNNHPRFVRSFVCGPILQSTLNPVTSPPTPHTK